MASSNPIKPNDIFDPKLWDTSSIEAYVKVLNEAKQGYNEVAQAQLKVLKNNELRNSEDLTREVKARETLNAANKAATQIAKDAAMAESLLNKSKIEAERLRREQIKTQDAINKQNRANNKLLDESNSKYKQATKELAGLKLQLKELEITGRTNGKLYKALGQEFVVLNGKVRDAEEGVGEFFRNVGNYPKELKALQRELQNLEPGTEQFNKLAKQAGELKDKINDAKQATQALGTDSKLTAFGNVFGQVKNDILDLDFKGAKEKAKLLADISKSITFAEAGKGLKDLGLTLLNTGKALLTNPLFLIAGTITAIGVAIYELKDRIPFLSEAFRTVGEFIDSASQSLKNFSDKLGLSDYAANKSADNQIKNAKRVSEEVKKQTDFQLELLRAKDKVTKEAEIEAINRQEEALNKEIEAARRKAKLILDPDSEEAKALNKYYSELLIKKEDFENDKILIEARYAKEAADKAKADKEKADKELVDNRIKEYESGLKRINEINEKETDTYLKAKERQKSEQDAQVEANTQAAKEEEERLKALYDYKQQKEKEIREKRKENAKQELQEVFNLTEQFLNAENKLKEDKLNAQIKKADDAIQQQRDLAARGLENRLADEEALKAKAELALIKQREKEVKQQKQLIFLKSLQAYLTADPAHPDQALPKAIIETALAQVISGSFFEGTENVKDDLKGNKVHNGRDGYVVAVDGSERVLTGKQNAMLGNISNDELARIGMMHNEGKLLPNYVIENNNTGSFSENIAQSALINGIFQTNKRLESLENIIKNKRETTVHWETHGILVESVKQNGVTKVIKHVSAPNRL